MYLAITLITLLLALALDLLFGLQTFSEVLDNADKVVALVATIVGLVTGWFGKKAKDQRKSKLGNFNR